MIIKNVITVVYISWQTLTVLKKRKKKQIVLSDHVIQ